MKLAQTTNLRSEDFTSEISWIGRLFTTLNPFITSVQNVFDNNIDFTTNIRSVVRSIDTTQLSFPIKFPWTFKEADPVCLVIAQAQIGTTPAVLVPAWSFNASDRSVSVSNIVVLTSTGVTPIVQGTQYKFTIRVTV